MPLRKTKSSFFYFAIVEGLHQLSTIRLIISFTPNYVAILLILADLILFFQTWNKMTKLVYKLTLKYLPEIGYDISNNKNPRVKNPVNTYNNTCISFSL